MQVQSATIKDLRNQLAVSLSNNRHVAAGAGLPLDIRSPPPHIDTRPRTSALDKAKVSMTVYRRMDQQLRAYVP